MKTPRLARKKVDSSAGKRIIAVHVLVTEKDVGNATLFNNLSDNLCAVWGHSQDDIQLLRQQKNIKVLKSDRAVIHANELLQKLIFGYRFTS